MKLVGVDGEDSSKATASSKGANPSSCSAPSSGRKFPVHNIPIWAMVVLGSIVCLAVPFYKKLRKIEDGAGKAAEKLAEGVEKVAEEVEKIASNVANTLPPDSRLNEIVSEVEHLAEEVDKDAKEAVELMHKVDHIEDEVDSLVKPTVEKGEGQSEILQDQKNKEKNDLSQIA